MDILEMHNRFDLIIDKCGSPYFSSDEKDDFLHRGEVQYVNDFFGNQTVRFNAESTDKDVERLSPLIVPVQLSTDSSGKLQFDDINTDTGGNLMYILNVAVNTEGGCESGFKKSRFVRHNDFFAHENNSFKKADIGYPTHRYFGNYLQFNPSSENEAYLTIINTPPKITLDDPDNLNVAGSDAVSSVLDDKVHDAVLLLALRFAGINIREMEYYGMISNESKSS